MDKKGIELSYINGPIGKAKRNIKKREIIEILITGNRLYSKDIDFNESIQDLIYRLEVNKHSGKPIVYFILNNGEYVEESKDIKYGYFI
jgi:hypothetical protein